MGISSALPAAFSIYDQNFQRVETSTLSPNSWLDRWSIFMAIHAPELPKTDAGYRESKSQSRSSPSHLITMHLTLCNLQPNESNRKCFWFQHLWGDHIHLRRKKPLEGLFTTRSRSSYAENEIVLPVPGICHIFSYDSN